MPETIRRSCSLTCVPWGETRSAALLESIQTRLPCERLAVGMLTLADPKPDEVLSVEGWTQGEIAAWLDGGYRQDEPFQRACQQGVAAVTVQKPCPHRISVLLPERDRRIGWWLLAARSSGPFSPIEQQMAGIILESWRMAFAQPCRAGVGRLLIGRDDRLMLADLATQADLLRNPDRLSGLLASLHPLVRQRFPELPDFACRDITISLPPSFPPPPSSSPSPASVSSSSASRGAASDEPSEGKKYTIQFCRRRAIEGDPLAVHWSIELSPLDDDDLPAIGLVEDDRIARSIAYIHENFRDSPSLSHIAKVVHVSPFHFHRLFTKHVGISPKHYLQKKQLQVAKQLLLNGNVPIGQIAQEAGFSSHGHFTSTFHRVVGVSPSEYRTPRD